MGTAEPSGPLLRRPLLAAELLESRSGADGADPATRGLSEVSGPSGLSGLFG